MENLQTKTTKEPIVCERCGHQSTCACGFERLNARIAGQPRTGFCKGCKKGEELNPLSGASSQ